MAVRSQRQRMRRTRTSAANGNGSRPAHSRRGVAATPVRRVMAPVALTNGRAAHGTAEMDRSDPQFQGALKSFSAAARYFHKQNYEKAQKLFQKVASSAPRELAERARVHLVLCEHKLDRPAPAPKTAADHYNRGVAELNARNLDLAIEHLSKADKSAPNGEHVKYALAAAHALEGNADAAIEHLKAAIALRPGNRFQVRYDEDFQPLASDPRFKRLVYARDGHIS